MMGYTSKHLQLCKQKKSLYLLVAIFTLAPAQRLFAQLGATSLNGPGIGFSVDYLPASRYIRPEDSVKTHSTSSQLRYNFGAVFSLSSRVDTITGKVRNWTLAASGSYTKFSNKDYEHNIFPEELLGTQLALQHYRNINRRWSLVWNLGAVPFAALGFVPPWLAAIGMSLSSLAVVLNSLRIRAAHAPGIPPSPMRERTA